MPFDGETYDRERDQGALLTQLDCVKHLVMSNPRRPYSLGEIVGILGLQYLIKASEASVSARLRDLRKPQFGGHTIHRERSGRLWLYSYVPKPSMEEQIQMELDRHG